MPARILLDLTFSDPLHIIEEEEEDGGFKFRGMQRPEKTRRLREIARFIETAEAAFPNSIILAANYKENGELEEDLERRWQVIANGNFPAVELKIPTDDKLASILDGQHRLHGFKLAAPDKLDMQLPCSIYFDLPNPYQAYVFATINFNQKKVDRSLAYQLFGIGVEQEDPDGWTPDKTAVFMSRKLGTEKDSALRHRIITAAENDEVLLRNKPPGIEWAVSTATVVDGILRLFSANPKRDRDETNKFAVGAGRSRTLLRDDKTPFRSLYLSKDDVLIYAAVKNFFSAVNELFWRPARAGSYIYRTVGIQALFNVLRNLASLALERKNMSLRFFSEQLASAGSINFTNNFFTQASGKGRTRIRNAILLKIGRWHPAPNEVGDQELAEYQRVTD